MPAKMNPAGPGFWVRDATDLATEQAAAQNAAALVELQQFIRQLHPAFQPKQAAVDLEEVRRRGKGKGPQSG